MDENLPSVSGVNLDGVRKLELSYSYTRPGAAKLAVEYVSGQLKVFEVDRFLIERLLEQLEKQGAYPPTKG